MGSPLSVYLQHSSFDGHVWLTHIIDVNNMNQKCFIWIFPVWPGFTANDYKWQTQCVTPSFPLHTTFEDGFCSFAELSQHAVKSLFFKVFFWFDPFVPLYITIGSGFPEVFMHIDLMFYRYASLPKNSIASFPVAPLKEIKKGIAYN